MGRMFRPSRPNFQVPRTLYRPVPRVFLNHYAVAKGEPLVGKLLHGFVEGGAGKVNNSKTSREARVREPLSRMKCAKG